MGDRTCHDNDCTRTMEAASFQLGSILGSDYELVGLIVTATPTSERELVLYHPAMLFELTGSVV